MEKKKFSLKSAFTVRRIITAIILFLLVSAFAFYRFGGTSQADERDRLLDSWGRIPVKCREALKKFDILEGPRAECANDEDCTYARYSCGAALITHKDYLAEAMRAINEYRVFCPHYGCGAWDGSVFTGRTKCDGNRCIGFYTMSIGETWQPPPPDELPLSE